MKEVLCVRPTPVDFIYKKLEPKGRQWKSKFEEGLKTVLLKPYPTDCMCLLPHVCATRHDHTSEIMSVCVYIERPLDFWYFAK